MATHTERADCRSCESSHVQDILSLGELNIVSFGNEAPQTKVPLELMLCGDCSLLQLKHTTRPDLLYNPNYGYKSGVNQTMRDQLQEIASSAESKKNLGPGDLVIDIGCNDGTLLDSYITDVTRVGFDPSKNVAYEAVTRLQKRGASRFRIFSDFFNARAFEETFPGQKAKVVTAISMFYDLEDPNKFVGDVKKVLDPEGLFVIQQNYLGGMLDQVAFDNICHEHLEYYSLTSLENLLRRHDMEVAGVELNGINGGSFRTFVRNSGDRPVRYESLPPVNRLREREKRMGLDTDVPYLRFAEKVRSATADLREFVYQEADKGKVVHIYGASTRGNTLVQAAGLDRGVIQAAAERNPDKWGTEYGATGIPIISEQESRAQNPDYYLVLPWFFKEEFVKREAQYLEGGGQMIFPLPRFEVVGR